MPGVSTIPLWKVSRNNQEGKTANTVDTCESKCELRSIPMEILEYDVNTMEKTLITVSAFSHKKKKNKMLGILQDWSAIAVFHWKPWNLETS